MKITLNLKKAFAKNPHLSQIDKNFYAVIIAAMYIDTKYYIDFEIIDVGTIVIDAKDKEKVYDLIKSNLDINYGIDITKSDMLTNAFLQLIKDLQTN